MDNLHPVVEIIVVAMLLISAFFALVGAIGMLRFKDFFQRLHAPTKATTLGVGGVLIASMIYSAANGRFGIHELLITLFLFITAPVSANLMAKAALHLKLPSKAGHPQKKD
ncbi:MAG: Na+/H+ antiporter subunit G [Methyloversatilis discipulorum]|jgi:multicomponent K+:H+ antiporter subunit G|uniref:Na+/H+ antiporter subunit G n=1 Tax=Methyloversatilis TaxID=378210 RepID=UPI0026EB0D9F|nr:Na+/H+ antiporter subunit G [Methyloversatilis discipulorum]MBT9519064.1 Na+/H+ antiporter subunit G [Methyloversatilis discipulorum]